MVASVIASGDIAEHRAILHVALRPVDDCAAGLHRSFARSREGPRGLGHEAPLPASAAFKPLSFADRADRDRHRGERRRRAARRADLDVPQPLQRAARAAAGDRLEHALARVADDVGGVAQAGREEPCGTTSTAVPVEAERLGDRGVDAAAARSRRRRGARRGRVDRASLRRAQVLEAVVRVEAALERDDEVVLAGRSRRNSDGGRQASPPAPRGAARGGQSSTARVTPAADAARDRVDLGQRPVLVVLALDQQRRRRHAAAARPRCSTRGTRARARCRSRAGTCARRRGGSGPCARPGRWSRTSRAPRRCSPP